MNRPDPTRKDPTVTLFDSLLFGKYKSIDVKFFHNLYSSLQFILSKYGIDIFDRFKIMRFSAT